MKVVDNIGSKNVNIYAECPNTVIQFKTQQNWPHFEKFRRNSSCAPACHRLTAPSRGRHRRFHRTAFTYYIAAAAAAVAATSSGQPRTNNTCTLTHPTSASSHKAPPVCHASSSLLWLARPPAPPPGVMRNQRRQQRGFTQTIRFAPYARCVAVVIVRSRSR
jgi:hypothetical protein